MLLGSAAGALCVTVGLAGSIYMPLVARGRKRQSAYRPEPSDWFCFVFLPLAAYAGLAASGFAAVSGHLKGLFGIGGAVLLLVLIGIRNAWDSVTYHVFVQRPAHRRG